MADFDDWESDDFVPTLNLPTAPVNGGGSGLRSSPLPPMAPPLPQPAMVPKVGEKKSFDDEPLIDGEVSWL